MGERICRRFLMLWMQEKSPMPRLWWLSATIRGVYALERARKHGTEAVCLSPKDFPDRAAFEQAFLEKVDSYELDLIVLAGFLVRIPEEMVKKYERRIINVHPSLIPSFCGVGYYGLKVHEAALARGVRVTGATVHFVDGGMDTGPILLQKAVEVKDGDTPEICSGG